MLLVGEQPGDREELAGKPFIGPAGQIFDRALGESGMDRAKVYVTNAVKHFKFEQQGKRRLHSKPDAGEIEACRWWLDKERAIISPPLPITLGATAGRGLMGHPLTLGKLRGEVRTLAAGSPGLEAEKPRHHLRPQGDMEGK